MKNPIYAPKGAAAELMRRYQELVKAEKKCEARENAGNDRKRQLRAAN